MPLPSIPASKPRFASESGAAFQEPTEPKKDIGWVGEIPPFEFFNWLHRQTFEWIDYLDKFSDAQLYSQIEAAETIGVGKAVVQKSSDGLAYLADSNAEDTVLGYRGISLNSASAGQTVKIARIYADNLSGLTPGAKYYIDAAGALTISKPSTGYAHVAGSALSATELIINREPFIYRPKYLDRIYLPTDDRTNTSSSFSRMFDYEGGVGKWHPSVLKAGRVFFEVAITGSAGSPYQIAFRFQGDSSGVVFESNLITLGNQSANEMSWFTFDLSSGNVVNLDLTSTILRGVNNVNTSGEAWEVQIKSLGGNYKLIDAHLVLLDI